MEVRDKDSTSVGAHVVVAGRHGRRGRLESRGRSGGQFWDIWEDKHISCCGLGIV